MAQMLQVIKDTSNSIMVKKLLGTTKSQLRRFFSPKRQNIGAGKMSRNRKTIWQRFVSSGLVKIRDKSTSDWFRLPLVLLFMTFPFKGKRSPRTDESLISDSSRPSIYSTFPRWLFWSERDLETSPTPVIYFLGNGRWLPIFDLAGCNVGLKLSARLEGL